MFQNCSSCCSVIVIGFLAALVLVAVLLFSLNKEPVDKV